MPPGSEIRWSHCPVGWIHVLDSLTDLLDTYAPGWALRQVKSDLAHLSFFPDELPPHASHRIPHLIQVIANRAAFRCEICGTSPAHGHVLDGWLTRLCRAHNDVADARTVPLIELRLSSTTDEISDRNARHAERTNLALSADLPHDPAPWTAPRLVDLDRIAALVLDAPGPREVIAQHAHLDVAVTLPGWSSIQDRLHRSGWPSEATLIWSTAPNHHLDGRAPVDALALLQTDLRRDDRLLLAAKLGEAVERATT